MIPSSLRSAAILLCLTQLVCAQVTITEFLADNRSGLKDSDDDESDWIEIRNNSASELNLDGWSLTDLPEDLTRWTFPSLTVPAGGYVVVFASGKDRRDPAFELHTNFGLNNNGEYLALVDPLGEIASEFNFPPQREDVAFGESGNIQEQAVVPEGAPGRWRVPTGTINGWQTLLFNDNLWSSGATGIGYDTGDDYDSLISTDVQAQMLNTTGSGYIRIPFTLGDASEVTGLNLNVRYDDGFVAYINGVQVAASSNIDFPVQWDSLANIQHLDADALNPESFNADVAIPALVDGQNVLAIQFLNATLDSSDLLLLPELIATLPDPAADGFDGYLITPSPGARNNNAVAGFVENTNFSVGRGFYSSSQSVTMTTPTEGAGIRYTTDGSAPSETSGTLYAGPVSISTTTILRALAFKEDFQSSKIVTQTYLFPTEVKGQADMDPQISSTAPYAATIEDDLSNNLPVLSLVVNDDDFFGPSGIYQNPSLSGRGAEVPLSVEFFNPSDPSDQFQINAGVRIHGGNARSHPKKPMRLYFRGEYCETRLEYPLFDGSPVESFDQLILRGGGHDSWSLAATFGRDNVDIPPHGLIMRDQFLRKTETEMGLLSPRGRYVHTYINGRYWGIYDMHERANASYFESHLGGSEDDYDVLHHREFAGQEYVVSDGTNIAWETARGIATAGITTADQYAAIQEYIDIDNLIDHCIVRMWSGDYDWCGPISRPSGDVTVFSGKNWYTGRRSRGKEGKFHFFCWDAEMSMGNHLMFNLFLTPTPPQRITDFDLTGANDSGSPLQFYDALRTYPEFQQRFGDRLQKHFFNDGTMSTLNNQERWNEMRLLLHSPMVAESARWGDEGTAGAPFNRNTTWQSEAFWIRDTYIAIRNETVLDQFQDRNLYPDLAAPVLSQHGGSVPVGFTLTMDDSINSIYYTTDGSEPVIPPAIETLDLVGEVAPAQALIPMSSNFGDFLGLSSWTSPEPPFNIDSWQTGLTAIGYERTGTNFQPLINLDISAAYGSNASIYVRVPFEIEAGTDIDSFDELTLAMKYDDGFIAYLNGVQIAASNNPADATYLSSALDNRSDALAEVYENFDITAFRDELQIGDNMLAIHALNENRSSSDLLCSPRLSATIITVEGGPSPGAMLYTGEITLNTTSHIRARAVSPGGTLSALTDATFLVGTLASPANLVISEINYRPLPPSTAAELAVANGRTDFEFIELMNISDEAIDLTQTSFSQGIEFDFSFGTPMTLLQPGEFALIVEDRIAFEARYGSDAAARIAGEFASDSKLSNNGE
ncbi:chitobiase/beta-hexosaminidase C-terminal domain-containing protein, partial [Akkermansiaceae bacterium]|nr:chitobiase/beta-hexosaminidase C-terminal domain-containing protein [Akkermansiaceae bacterium]